MNKYKKIPNRSDLYQQILLEISYPHELLDVFSDSDSVYKRLNPFAYNDEIAELEEELKKELWRIIDDNLTDRQKEVVKLYASGKTQIEIAKILGVNQSSITKCITGDTKIYTSSGPIEIADLWMRWQIVPETIANYQVACINDQTGQIIYNSICNVVCQGEKPVLKIITASDKTIKATRDHKFYTSRGWVELQYAVRDRLQVAVMSDAPEMLDKVGSWVKFEDIASCEECPAEMVFDLSMEAPYHNFFGNLINVLNCLNGNVDYKNKDNKGKPITYGGVRLKLQKIVKDDVKVNEILQRIADLRDNDPF